MFVSVAHAMGSAGGGQAAGPEAMFSSFMPILLMLAIFYFLLIRPQQKKAKEHKALLDALKKGDTVLTNAGFIGRIVDVEDDVLTLDLGETKVQVMRPYVAGLSASKLGKMGKKDSKKDAKDASAAEENASDSE
jgi:preprotein translocase subunit YajC